MALRKRKNRTKSSVDSPPLGQAENCLSFLTRKRWRGTFFALHKDIIESVGSSYPGTEDTDDLSHDFDLDFDVFGNPWENLFEQRADPDPVVEIRVQNFKNLKKLST